jgi:hypothetical protein
MDEPEKIVSDVVKALVEIKDLSQSYHRLVKAQAMRSKELQTLRENFNNWLTEHADLMHDRNLLIRLQALLQDEGKVDKKYDEVLRLIQMNSQ